MGTFCREGGRAPETEGRLAGFRSSSLLANEPKELRLEMVPDGSLGSTGPLTAEEIVLVRNSIA